MSHAILTRREQDAIWIVLVIVGWAVGLVCGAMLCESRAAPQATEDRR